MTIPVGTQLGSHEISGLLGKGGMGEVYRARDTKLKREVAIKILPEEFSRDPGRVTRFQREAEVLASLNHPNIAAIYDLQEANGIRFLVLELVEGETLADRIQRGPIPVEETLELAKHICEALEAAHDRNVVHRDLKPANVKITPDGRVKVLDFGLAKAMSGANASATAGASVTFSESPTLTLGATQAGVILGTAAYMSPEQAKGFEVDARSDTFAFGTVLYEMLTGRQAFHGETVSDVLASVLAREPDFSLLPPNLNPRIHELLQRCFQKNPKRRWQAIGDLLADLETIAAAPRAIPAQPGGKATALWKKALPWAAALAAVIAFSVLAYFHFSEETRVLKLSVVFPEKADFNPGSLPAVSPDGRHIAYAVIVDGQQRLWVRDLDSPNARLLAGTEGAVFPFWSPDSRWIGFFAGGKLKKVEAGGGPIATLCDAPNPRGATWNQQGVILFAPSASTGLLRVSAAGGTATPFTVLDSKSGERRHGTPWFLPDGRHFLYTAVNAAQEKTTVYVADLSATDELRNRKPLVVANSNAAYAQGYLLFARANTLLAQAFDYGKNQITGEAIHLAEQIDTFSGQTQAEFSVSQTGILAYTTGGAGAYLQLTWIDRSGSRVGTAGALGDVHWPRISPDGNTVAYVRRNSNGSTGDIWFFDIVRGTDSRFTLGPSNNLYPVWSPDGSHIALFSAREAGPAIIQKPTTRTGSDEVFDSGFKRPEHWSPDGRYIVELMNTLNNAGIAVLPLFGDRKVYAYADTRYIYLYPRVSPDGRWLAYVSNESGRQEVYVGTFPMPGGNWQVSVNGGSFPVWSRDGKELYYVGADGMMMAVPIESGSKFNAGVPKPLFPTTGLGTGDYGAYDVSKDGRFLMAMSAVQSTSVPMTVVVNWTAALKR